jgi:hypothetical protein
MHGIYIGMNTALTSPEDGLPRFSRFSRTILPAFGDLVRLVRLVRTKLQRTTVHLEPAPNRSGLSKLQIQPAVFQAPDKAVILSEALRRSIANRGLHSAESKDPGDAYWQMLLGAFRPGNVFFRSLFSR